MQVNINSLGGGGFAERINRELQNVAENVMDPNTKATATRSITCTITIKPDETRQIGATEISVKSSLAPAKGIPTSFLFDFDKDGKVVAKELASRDPNQLQIDNDGDVATGTGKKVVNGPFR